MNPLLAISPDSAVLPCDFVAVQKKKPFFCDKGGTKVYILKSEKGRVNSLWARSPKSAVLQSDFVAVRRKKSVFPPIMVVLKFTS